VAQTSPVGIAVTVGAGALIAVVAVWSLLAADPTREFLLLAIVGFALLLAPTAGGFTADVAALTAWVPGIVVTALGVTGYLRGDSLDFAGTVRDEAIARYRERFRSPVTR
jgi:hypothetical protein